MVLRMEKAVIFTGLVKIDRNLVGTAIIYRRIAEILLRKGYRVTLVVPQETDLVDDGLEFKVYHRKENQNLIDEAAVIVFGAYPPVEPLLYAYKKRKKIITYFWSVAPLGSLEFKDAIDFQKQNRLHQYITVSYNLSLLLSDKVFCRDEEAKKLILGSLLSLGRINLKNYEENKQLKNIIEAVPFGIETSSPRHTRDIYRGKLAGIGRDDFLLIWNGGIWNWNDGENLIRAMDLLKERNIRLIFQGFRHPDKNQLLSLEAQKTLSLVEKLNLRDKNVFFVDQWIAHEERGNYLTEADVGVVTSPNIPEANFFLKTRVYDYLWAELPVILNDSEAFAKVVLDNNLGLVAKTGDYQDLAEKILKLYQDRNLPRQIRQSIKRFKQGISWEKTLVPIEKYLEKPESLEDKYDRNNLLLRENIKLMMKLFKKLS